MTTMTHDKYVHVTQNLNNLGLCMICMYNFQDFTTEQYLKFQNSV